MKPADAKLQRWIDLIAALLRARFGERFEDLKTLVPAYGHAKDPKTIARMFERDKDELRALGIPIRVREEETDDGTTQRYYVRPGEMYLPYLALVSARSQHKVPPAGYRDVPTLVFEPDELSALLRAAHRVRSIGEPALTHDAESATRKLTYDLALGATAGESEHDAARVADAASAPSVSILGEALLRRKRVRFEYYSINRDSTDARQAEPFGLFFAGSHWYLAARDTSIGDVRSFRVSRLRHLTVNDKKPQSADYEIPRDFSLARHARGKEPWEIGDDAPEEMIAEFRGESGATVAARSLGAEVPGAPLRRRFQVRRVDSFARWLMSFAGEAVPVSPEHLCEQYRAIVKATLAVYSA